MQRAPLNPKFLQAQKSAQPAATQSKRSSVRVPDPATFKTTGDAVKSSAQRSASSLPAHYDLRQLGRVSPVRSQGSDGSCWAFSAMASLESNLGGKYDFSEKNMRDTNGFDWGPNDGGNRTMAGAYLARWAGPVAESADPFSTTNHHSPSNLPRLKDVTDVYLLPDSAGANDTATIKRALMKYGAVSTTFSSNPHFISWAYDTMNNTGDGWADHAVNIVGWDDNYPRSNFLVPPDHNGAWIVRNSWGTDWGKDGYIYVSYADKFIGHNNAVYVARDKGTSDSIYQYDKLGATSSMGYGTEGAWFSNIFTATSHSQAVNGVGFWAMAADIKYDIYVVPVVNGTKDLSAGQKVASGRVPHAGYQVINFRPVPVTPGHKFATVVKAYSPSTQYVVPLEAPIPGFSSGARASSGQSFISLDGSYWDDVTRTQKNTNVSLKAFTISTRAQAPVAAQPAQTQPTAQPTPAATASTPAPAPAPAAPAAPKGKAKHAPAATPAAAPAHVPAQAPAASSRRPNPAVPTKQLSFGPPPTLDWTGLNVWSAQGPSTRAGANMDLMVLLQDQQANYISGAPITITLTDPAGVSYRTSAQTDGNGTVPFRFPGYMNSRRGQYKVLVDGPYGSIETAYTVY